MRYDVKLIRFVSTVCVVMFLLLEFSNGEVKPEDCTPKMEYWSPGSSESLFDNPHCVPCPPNWANCKDQPIHERKSCYDSCGKEENSSSTTSTTANDATSRSMKVNTTAVVDKLPNAAENPEDGKKNNSSSNKVSSWRMAAIVSLVVVFVLAVLLVAALSVICLLRRPRRLRGIQDLNGREARAGVDEENFPLNTLPATEAPAPSAPADTMEDDESLSAYKSSFNLREDCG